MQNILDQFKFIQVDKKEQEIKKDIYISRCSNAVYAGLQKPA